MTLRTQYTEYTLTVRDIGYRNRLGRVFNYPCTAILKLTSGFEI
jgi:hypothetical protein